MNERKNYTMVRFIQSIIEAIRFPTLTPHNYFDHVDPNLVRYFRTEYGRDWKTALNEHLHYKSKI